VQRLSRSAPVGLSCHTLSVQILPAGPLVSAIDSMTVSAPWTRVHLVVQTNQKDSGEQGAEK
jgi:hypothetical protein